MLLAFIWSLDWQRLLGCGLGLAAGLGVYILFVNRVLGLLRDGPFKRVFVLSVFASIVGGLGVFGYASGMSTGVLLPVFILVWMGVGEAQRILIRYHSRGSPPLSQEGPRLALWRPVTTTDLQVKRYQVRAPNWQGERLRVAHLSDLHVTDQIALSYYQEVMRRINQEQPDLVFITGDFITERRFIPLLAEILRLLESRLGVFAILGNHDYWADAQQVAETIQQAGVQVLWDGWQRLKVDGQGEVVLVGCELPWSGRIWTAPPIQKGDFALALAHTGDHIYRLSRAGVTAVFSGHYHAGQVQLPGFGPLVVPSVYGRRFSQGHFVVRGTHLFVSAGVGAAKPPLRVYCPPDVLIIDFKPAGANPRMNANARE